MLHPVLIRAILSVFAVTMPAALCLGLERKPIVFSLSEGARNAWIEGTVSFPPGSLRSPGSFRLMEEQGGEVPAMVEAERSWFDGSVMLLRVGFAGRKSQEKRIWLEWGKEVRDPRRLENAGKEGPAVGFRIYEDAGSLRVRGNVDVGTMLVRVEKHADFTCYWYLVPVLFILSWLVWRKLKLRRPKAA